MPVLIEKERSTEPPTEPLRASLAELLARKLKPQEQGRNGGDRKKRGKRP